MKFLLGMALGAGLVIFATVILNVKWRGREREEESTESLVLPQGAFFHNISTGEIYPPPPRPSPDSDIGAKQ